MFFNTAQTCPARACGTAVDVYLEAPDIPEANATFIFECPACRSRIFFPVAAVRVVEQVPEGGVVATRYVRSAPDK